MKKRRCKHDLHQRARWLVQIHVKRGKLVKPGVCQQCGGTFPLGKIEGHHMDYTRPLDVVWLCKPCHMKITVETILGRAAG